jgi:outer membrane beta-barrel protein
MRQTIFSTLALIILISCGQTAWCQTQNDEGKVYAIQNRLYHRTHEFDFNLGYIADDDFFHVYPIGVGYTFHFNEHISWEVGRLQYLFNSEKDIQDTLREDFNVRPEKFPEQKYMAHTHLVFKPLYGKHALMNRSVINNEIYFFGGPGLVHYEWLYSTGRTEAETAFSLSFGVGLKYFLSTKWCLNVEIRDLVNFREDETENNITFGLGVGYRFNMAPRKVEDDPTMKKLKRILNDD